jgi:hypothetical protein
MEEPIPTDDQAQPAPAKPTEKIDSILPEVEIYLNLLVVIFLIDRKELNLVSTRKKINQSHHRDRIAEIFVGEIRSSRFLIILFYGIFILWKILRLWIAQPVWSIG